MIPAAPTAGRPVDRLFGFRTPGVGLGGRSQVVGPLSRRESDRIISADPGDETYIIAGWQVAGPGIIVTVAFIGPSTVTTATLASAQ